jgi:SAM-dependent methyltransferase
VQPRWRELRIHESSPTLTFFAEQCPRYSCSYNFEDTTPGEWKHGKRCENLELLTFADATFDLFVTQDVLEHVVRPDRALAEITRVLKPGGAHVFTTPKHKDLVQSRPRVHAEGTDVRYILEPVFHGSPIGDGRSLVTWDYGADFESLAYGWSGYLMSSYVLRDRRFGIDGEFLEVFVTVKEPVNAVRE